MVSQRERNSQECVLECQFLFISKRVFLGFLGNPVISKYRLFSSLPKFKSQILSSQTALRKKYIIVLSNISNSNCSFLVIYFNCNSSNLTIYHETLTKYRKNRLNLLLSNNSGRNHTSVFCAFWEIKSSLHVIFSSWLFCYLIDVLCKNVFTVSNQWSLVFPNWPLKSRAPTPQSLH